MNRDVSDANMAFWNELCGSGLAKSLGIADASAESLQKYDDFYLGFYPYLPEHIPFQEMRERDVLEVGLGYGTVSQKIAEAGARYVGLDIAAGPVAMVNHRLAQAGLAGHALQGSILQPDVPDEGFDYVVAIGSLHHTGDLPRAIEMCMRALRSGGRLIFMVYYAYSYRRFRNAPAVTLRYLLREMAGYRGVVGASSERERAAYDASGAGGGAPHTDWISRKSLRSICGKYGQFTARLENIDQERPFQYRSREELLRTRWPSWLGLDLYASVIRK